MTESTVHLFFCLIVAHILADHYFQFEGWAVDKIRNKEQSSKLWVHLGLVTLLSFLTTFSVQAAILTGLFHSLIDFGKVFYGKSKVRVLLIDQSLHLLSLVLVALIIQFFEWNGFISFEDQISLPQLIWLVVLLGITFPYGTVLHIILYPLAPEGRPSHISKYIGIAERVLIISIFYFDLPFILGGLLGIVLFAEYRRLGKNYTQYALLGTFLSVIPTFLLCFVSKSLAAQF
ncbi:DUF3307 domain-containing protein [Jiulongibacter sp. NS-SX5]|uniref:DUF3307 domain-containing protein n=1 Tax=Jiulongibacter sp. NS-SX5 TaxID=3463854 RepID=UPI0040594C08